jgi:NADH:ubiquinone reductase (H+-translocating)
MVSDTNGVFAVGDTSTLSQGGRPLPGVAQVAIQQGRYVGKVISRQIKGKAPRRPFRYFDKGNMAVVGKNFAILERGWIRTSGFMTWLVWVFIHLMFLPQLQNRLRVQRQWLWSYWTGQRSSRLISEPAGVGNQVSGDSMTDSADYLFAVAACGNENDKAIGLTIPESFLALADEVIE